MTKKSRSNKKNIAKVSSTEAENLTATPAASWLLVGAAALILVAVIGGSLWYLMRPASSEQAGDTTALAEETTPAQAENAPTETPRDWPPGAANYCFGGPRFSKGLGFEPGQSFIGTSPGQFVGLYMADATGNGRYYQDPTWDDAGNMGAFVYDGNGNMYLTPAPFMNLYIDKLVNQTKLYRVDSDSAAMTMLLDLPAASPPSAANPFGLMGLFYDCDTSSLYASSVAGSTAQSERGRIFQVDLKTNAVVATIEDVDAIGVGVYNGANGKRLYYGSGRNTGIYSLALDNQGHFTGEPRLEFYLAGLPDGHNDKGTRITFTQEGQMVIKGINFTYTLSVERPVIYRDYSFSYNSSADAWELVTIEQRTK